MSVEANEMREVHRLFPDSTPSGPIGAAPIQAFLPYKRDAGGLADVG